MSNSSKSLVYFYLTFVFFCILFIAVAPHPRYKLGQCYLFNGSDRKYSGKVIGFRPYHYKFEAGGLRGYLPIKVVDSSTKLVKCI